MRRKSAQAPPERIVKPFHDIRASELDAAILKEHLSAFGYVLVRNLLFPKDVHILLCEIARLASQAGFLQQDRDPLDRMVNPCVAVNDSDPALKQLNEQIFRLEGFHALPHHPSLRHMMELIVGPHVLVHPKPIPRLVFPNPQNFRFNAHQDYPAFTGDFQTYTVWLPLHDCSPKLGPLQVLEGSHRFGLQKVEPGGSYSAWKTAEGSPWVGGQISVGDVLILNSLTVHAASANTSSQFRICLDSRFQSYDRPINPANLVFLGPNGKSWESTYAHWRSSQHKYYWNGLPLQLHPSAADLAALQYSAELPEVRARCAKILSQLFIPEDAAAVPLG